MGVAVALVVAPCQVVVLVMGGMAWEVVGEGHEVAAATDVLAAAGQAPEASLEVGTARLSAPAAETCCLFAMALWKALVGRQGR